MRTRVIRRAVLIGLIVLTLIGCGRQAARTSPDDDGLLAIGPNHASLAAVRPDHVLEAVEAAGGLARWMECRRVDVGGIVAAYRSDNSYYLTEHSFTIYPWSEAIKVSAREPQGRFVWRLARDRFEQAEGIANRDVSPLAGMYQDYASAVLQIVTAPARMLDRRAQLNRQPLPVQIRGQEYDPIDVRFLSREGAAGGAGRASNAAGLYWTEATYYQSRRSSRVEMIWLASPARQDFLVVRGYDYASVAGVLIPMKIEIFHSDPESRIGQRIATIDLSR